MTLTKLKTDCTGGVTARVAVSSIKIGFAQQEQKLEGTLLMCPGSD